VTAPQASPRPDPRGDLFDATCATRLLLDRLGTKWTSMAIKRLAEASPAEVRFADLRRRMPGVSSKMLAQTLRSLERDGLVSRRVEPTVPPRVYYGLTEMGRTLEAPLDAVRDWAESHMAAVDRAAAEWDSRRHTSP
jgi:DNA-binding HxlR family transcriptional regulator